MTDALAAVIEWERNVYNDRMLAGEIWEHILYSVKLIKLTIIV